MLLIAATALLTILVDALPRALRRSLRLTDLPTRLSQPRLGFPVFKGLKPFGEVRGRSP